MLQHNIAWHSIAWSSMTHTLQGVIPHSARAHVTVSPHTHTPTRTITRTAVATTVALSRLRLQCGVHPFILPICLSMTRPYHALALPCIALVAWTSYSSPTMSHHTYNTTPHTTTLLQDAWERANVIHVYSTWSSNFTTPRLQHQLFPLNTDEDCCAGQS
jgi:hypothetical protein